MRFGPAAIAPAIAGAPQTNTVPVGNPATFSVAATGSAPLFYQWYFGSTLLAGATQSTFTTNNVSYASAGNYSVVVSNLTTQIASVTNVLAVTAGAPTITPTPLPSYVETVGDHLAWAPVITGTLPITNYWYWGSTLVQSNVTPGATGSLVLTNIQTINSGTYTLVVSNSYGHASAAGFADGNSFAPNPELQQPGGGAHRRWSANFERGYGKHALPGPVHPQRRLLQHHPDSGRGHRPVLWHRRLQQRLHGCRQSRPARGGRRTRRPLRRGSDPGP